MKLRILFFIILFAGIQQAGFSQSYFTYQCNEFSVLLKCNNANTQVLDVQFSAKDSKGQWRWNKYDVFDYESFEDTEIGGFIFYCKDGVGKSFAVDYYRDEDYILVHAMNADGSFGREWKLMRREE